MAKFRILILALCVIVGGFLVFMQMSANVTPVADLEVAAVEPRDEVADLQTVGDDQSSGFWGKLSAAVKGKDQEQEAETAKRNLGRLSGHFRSAPAKE